MCMHIYMYIRILILYANTVSNLYYVNYEMYLTLLGYLCNINNSNTTKALFVFCLLINMDSKVSSSKV